MKNDLFYSSGIGVLSIQINVTLVVNALYWDALHSAHAIQFNGCISRSTLFGVVCLFVSLMLEFRKRFDAFFFTI